MTYNNKLKELIKATGQELIDQAEGIVDEIKGTIGFTIQIELTKDGRLNWEELPEITYIRKTINNKALDYLIKGTQEGK